MAVRDGCQEVAHTDAGAWTDTSNARTQMGLVISAIQTGGAEVTTAFAVYIDPITAFLV